MRIIGPYLLDLVNFLPNALIQLVVEQRVEHLVEVHSGRSRYLLNVLVQRREEVVQQVLVLGAQVALAAVDDTGGCLGDHQHIIIANAVGCELLRIFFELFISEEHCLVVDGNARLYLN